MPHPRHDPDSQGDFVDAPTISIVARRALIVGKFQKELHQPPPDRARHSALNSYEMTLFWNGCATVGVQPGLAGCNSPRAIRRRR
jgi:hypothetical protein